jgi:hypothetical protein
MSLNTTSLHNQQSWDFVQKTTDPKTGTDWQKPSGGYSVYPVGYKTTYTVTFSTDCPQNEINFIFAASGYNLVYLNGQLIHGWAEAYPTYHTITLKKPELKCGCNIIEVVVYNYCCVSPCSLTYSLTQSKGSCYDCEKLGITHYNRATCACECATRNTC